MKILMVHNFYQIAGGEDTVVANEKKLLEDHGHEVVLYTRDNKEINKMGKLRKLFLFFTTIFNRQTVRDIKRIIAEEKIDIVHVHNTLNLISPAVYYVAKSCNVPVVQTIHNYRLICPGAILYRDSHICEECIKGGVFCSLKHKCYRNSLVQTFTCALSLNVHRSKGLYKDIYYICLTEFNKNKLLEARYKERQVFDEDKIFVKPNFMTSSDRAIVPAVNRKNQIMFAGRLDESKGVDLLLKAWKKYDEGIRSRSFKPILIICGSGPMEEWVRDYIKDNKLDSVCFLGKINHEEVVKNMSESIATVLPTRWYEGFPMSIAESLSVGTPVIGPDMGNVGDILEEDISGYKFTLGAKDEETIDSLEKSIDKAFDSMKGDTKNESIYDRCYEVYKNDYSAQKNYDELITIYQAVLVKRESNK